MEHVIGRVSLPMLLGAILTFFVIYQASDLKQTHISASATLITSLRETFASSKADKLMKLISEAGDKAFLGFAVYFAAHWLGKTEGFTVMTAFALSVTLLGMLKLVFTEGRPFFVDPKVLPASCKDLEYGFPSGHATVSTATYLTLFYCAC